MTMPGGGSESRAFLDCCSTVSGSTTELADSKSRNTLPPWIGDLQKGFDDALHVHFSRHEQLLQKCLERLTDFENREERQQKLDLKTKERRGMTRGGAEPKAVESETPGFFSECVDESDHAKLADRQQDLMTQEAIAPMHAKLEDIERQLLELNTKVSGHALAEPVSPNEQSSCMSAVIPGDEAGDASDDEKDEQAKRLTDRTLTSLMDVSLSEKRGQGRASRVMGSLRRLSGSIDDSIQNSAIADRGSFRKRRQRCLLKVLQLIEWWQEAEEPRRTGSLASFVDSQCFESLCATVIMVNAIFTLLSTNWEMANLGQDPTPLMVFGEVGFLSFYTIELVLKLMVHRCFFFSGEDLRWNVFDLVLVVFSIYDQLSTALETDSSGDDSGGLNLTFMRSFRVFKMAKILRAVRAMRFITDLRLMLNSILGSFTSLFWSFVMLLFIFYIFSLIFVQGCITFLLDEKTNVDHHKYHNIHKYFGSVQDSIMSLIQATTGGNDWYIFYDAVSLTGDTNAALFIFFMGFFHIALLNVLTGIFVENAMKLAQPDPYTVALEERKREVMEALELRQVCAGLSCAETGTISSEDFEREFHHGRLRAHLSVLGLDIKDAKKFFSVLTAASDHEVVDIDMFVNGCMKLKGSATAIDLQSLMFETRQAAKDVSKLVEGSLTKSNSFLEGLHGHMSLLPPQAGHTRSQPFPPLRRLSTWSQPSSPTRQWEVSLAVDPQAAPAPRLPPMLEESEQIVQSPTNEANFSL